MNGNGKFAVDPIKTAISMYAQRHLLALLVARVCVLDGKSVDDYTEVTESLSSDVQQILDQKFPDLPNAARIEFQLNHEAEIADIMSLAKVLSSQMPDAT